MCTSTCTERTTKRRKSKSGNFLKISTEFRIICSLPFRKPINFKLLSCKTLQNQHALAAQKTCSPSTATSHKNTISSTAIAMQQRMSFKTPFVGVVLLAITTFASLAIQAQALKHPRATYWPMRYVQASICTTMSHLFSMTPLRRSRRSPSLHFLFIHTTTVSTVLKLREVKFFIR